MGDSIGDEMGYFRANGGLSLLDSAVIGGVAIALVGRDSPRLGGLNQFADGAEL